MKLYPKKINSLDALEREKARLKRRKKALDREDLLPDGLFGGSGSGAGGVAGMLGDALHFKSPALNIVKDIAVKVVSRMMEQGGEEEPEAPKKSAHREPEQKEGKSVLHRLAWEFIGGYLKWKAIELSYKGIRYYVRRRKEGSEE
jgi:hypothetical protein